ncbi:ROK family protein [Enterococcus faecalis]|nr:ROK family protein [Enterococcus faecalis]
MTEYILAIDLGGSSIKFGVISSDLKIQQASAIKTNTENYEQLLVDICNEVSKFTCFDPAGITLSIPGRIDVRQKRIITAGAITCLSGQPLVDDLQNKFRYLL